MTDRSVFIRPSGIAAAELCPAAPLMQARAVDAIPAVQRIIRAIAEQGTLGHSAIAQTLELTYQRSGWQAPDDALAQMAGVIDRLEAWTRDAVRKCVAYAVALVDDALRKAESFAGNCFISILIEMKLSGAGVAIPRGGTADLIILIQNGESVLRVVVCDYKLGFLDQGEAADHLQLGCYSAMAFDKYKPSNGVTVHLAQGRRQEFSSADYQAADIEAVRVRILSAVHGAWADDPVARPHIDACRYCRCLTHCGAVRLLLDQLKDRADLFGEVPPYMAVSMASSDPGAIAGDEPADRIRLAALAAMARKHLSANPIARRFAEEARELARVWTAEIQSKTSEEASRG